ncbi:hypothetical protein D3C86_1687420 [compost metagenome]
MLRSSINQCLLDRGAYAGGTQEGDVSPAGRRLYLGEPLVPRGGQGHRGDGVDGLGAQHRLVLQKAIDPDPLPPVALVLGRHLIAEPLQDLGQCLDDNPPAAVVASSVSRLAADSLASRFVAKVLLSLAPPLLTSAI